MLSVVYEAILFLFFVGVNHTAASQIIWDNNTHFDDGQTHNFANQTIMVTSNITIMNSTTVDVENCQILLDKEIKITVQGRGVFKCTSDASDFYASDPNQTWGGIYVVDDASHLIFTAPCSFKDANNAIVSQNGGIFEIYNGCVFDRNEISLKVENYNGDHQGVFYGNTINGNSGAATPTIGINIENVIATTPGYKLKIGDASAKNYINNQSDLAIQINNSDVKLENTDVDIGNGNFDIHIFGSGSSSDLRNYEFDDLSISVSGTWNANRYGIWILNGFNLDADNIMINNMGYAGHIMITNSYGDVNITNSTFINPSNNIQTGIKVSGSHNTININNQNHFYFNDDNCIKINIK